MMLIRLPHCTALIITYTIMPVGTILDPIPGVCMFMFSWGTGISNPLLRPGGGGQADEQQPSQQGGGELFAPELYY